MTETDGNQTLCVLLVDDEEEVLSSTSYLLRSAGVGPVRTLQDGRQVTAVVAETPVAVIVLDLIMPHLSGVKVLEALSQDHPEIPVIVMTASQDVETAVRCMKEGAFDYLLKPVEENRFLSSVKHALEVRKLRREVESLRSSLLQGGLRDPDAFAAITTRSRKMVSTFQYAEAIAGSSEPILITGETGTGKEMMAQALHRLSGRPGELVCLNSAGIDDAFFSDTLFGHVKGAFTGAIRDRGGLVAQAGEGTLFLDEIGDLPLASQVKLLRLLQEGRYYPVGSDVPKLSRARIVAATNRDLRRAMAEGTFRQDLYFRLASHSMTIPPLRDRRDDLRLLVELFLGEAAASLEKDKPAAPDELFTLLSVYDFPGNVRELRALVFDAVARHRSGSILSIASFREAIKVDVDHRASAASLAMTADLAIGDKFPTLREATRFLIDEAMHRADDNQGVAATLLGISRQSLNRRLRARDDN